MQSVNPNKLNDPESPGNMDNTKLISSYYTDNKFVTIKKLITTASDDIFLHFCMYFQRKYHGISCESRQTIYTKCQVLFSLKKKKD